MSEKFIITKKTIIFITLINLLRFAFSPLILLWFFAFKLMQIFKKKSLISIVTTGGTAGHIFPAIRFFAKSIKLHKKIHFVSNNISVNLIQKLGSINAKKFTYTEHANEHYEAIAITFLPIIPVSLRNIKSLFKFVFSMIFAFLIMLRRGFFIENVIGFGGYASFPMLFFGVIFCKKIYLHEQNTVFGAVNELFLPFASKVFTAFPVENKTQNCHYVGMPLSHKIESQPIFRIPERFGQINILIISGSSGGDEAINSIVPAIILLSKKHPNKLHIYHQTRPSLVNSIKEKYFQHEISATVEPFFENIHELLPSVHLCISRSGASSIVDLLSFGVTTIFVPLKNSARNHQIKNATWVVSNNAGFLYKPWESNVYNFAALIAFALSNASNQGAIKSQSLIKKNARAVMCNAIWG